MAARGGDSCLAGQEEVEEGVDAGTLYTNHRLWAAINGSLTSLLAGGG